ncbi:MAG: primosomal protein N' [Lachnospiraceae bacterium]|nr:primosomal protein N' [Lachnospiraceae bacterium]
MAYFANIIIDISHEKLDRTFQYKIPEELFAQIHPGVQVNVPFGKGNRLMKGFVIEVTNQAEFEESRIKEIDSLAAGSVAVETQLIALAAWIRKNYGATMNQALKTVIPVKQEMKVKEKRSVHLLLEENAAKEQLAVYQKKHNTARARLLEELLLHKELSYDVITRKLNVTGTVIRALEKQNILEIRRETTYRNPVGHLESKGYDLQLNAMQQAVVNRVIQDMQAGANFTYLLHGVTGSGKTEVYMELIADVLSRGKQAIVLIPEIALTYQTVMRFYSRFGDKVSIMNSRLSAGERYDQFLRAKNGEISIMIGPRSALFTPFANLGLIIIDEEHESSYKSETLPKYHARETAIQRAKMAGASVVLGSATPSIDSFYKTKTGEYQLLEMKDRVSKRPMPTCHVVDLREELKGGNLSILSRKLQELMEERLKKKQQIMLFLNRRGISGFISCRACGHVVKCPHCDVSLSLHNRRRLVCHYCGYEEEAPSTCPECGSKYISGFKAGTQKIEEIVKQRFPQAKVLRMDFDTTRSKDSYEQILSAFSNQEADILIGTQMIVKGHDFPNVTLVGILAADLSMYVSDYRASERTFQLLTQAAGRAGRGKELGEVVIQTYNPKHYSIVTAKNQDYHAFYEEEIRLRQLLSYPPVSHMALLLITAEEEMAAEQMAVRLANVIRKADIEGLQLIGPASAAIGKVNDIYRKVIYLKHKDYDCLVNLKDRIELFLKDKAEMKKIHVTFDFDPMNGV